MKFSASFAAAFAATASALPSALNTRAGYSATPDARVLMGHTGNIYLADYYKSEKKFTFAINETSRGAPSWMTYVAPNRLYAVDENSKEINYYEIDLANNKLNLKASQNGSSGVVHLELNKAGTRMVGAAYGNGTVDVWNVENGGLKLMKTIKSDDKLGPNEARQSAAHPHQVLLDPTGRYFTVNDLGTDSILIIDSKKDAFKKLESARVDAGCGPRHAVWYPAGASKATHYIVVCEMLNKALVYSVKYETDKLTFTQTQAVSTYGDAYPPANATTASAGEIAITPNNQDIYISNRLSGNTTDSIAHFKVSKSDCGSVELKFSDTVSSGGLIPRMFSLDKTADYIFSANQDGDYGVAVIDIGKNGKLDSNYMGTIAGPLFGEAGYGPQFIQQIA